jgi:hypothetical protein
MSNERDELIRDIASIDGPATIGGPDLADGLLALGYRKAAVVTTAEELDALPVGSVVLDYQGRSWQKYEPRQTGVYEYHEWQCPDGGFVRAGNSAFWIENHRLTVLYVGGNE